MKADFSVLYSLKYIMQLENYKNKQLIALPEWFCPIKHCMCLSLRFFMQKWRMDESYTESNLLCAKLSLQFPFHVITSSLYHLKSHCHFTCSNSLSCFYGHPVSALSWSSWGRPSSRKPSLQHTACSESLPPNSSRSNNIYRTLNILFDIISWSSCVYIWAFWLGWF